MDKSTNVHHKVYATFLSTYYNALAEGKTENVAKMYLPNAKIAHWGSDGAASLSKYAKGARIVVVKADPHLIDNTHLNIFVNGSITIEGEKAKDFQHDVELVHHNTTADQLTFGIASDVLRAAVAPPPPPKMKFDDWAADTPQLSAQNEGEAVPAIELAAASKGTTPSVTPKVAPAPTPAATPAPVSVAVEEKKEEVVAKVEEKKEEAPAAPKGWANIVRSDKPLAAKPVVSVVDPTKKVAPAVEKKEEAVKTEKKEKKEDEEKKERRSNKSAAPIFYDIFVKGFPEGTTEGDVASALGLKVAISNTKIDTKEDKSGVRRVFVYVKFSAEDLAKQSLTREDAIANVISSNKNTKVGNSRLSVEEVKEKEKYNADGSAAKSRK